ncbi:MAG: hypothetical protein IPH63_14620 [Flavobacteriales bacterium]|nr:hypothetical protein [Flavobacteriales bacterium]
MHELVAHCIDHQDRLLAFSTLALEVLAQFTGFGTLTSADMCSKVLSDLSA